MSPSFIGHQVVLADPLWLAGSWAGATWSRVAWQLLAGVGASAACGASLPTRGLLILSRLARAASCRGLEVPKCNERGQATMGLHCSSLWVMFAVVLPANPGSLWERTTQGCGCREAGTKRDHYCTIYQGVVFVHRYCLVSVPKL